MKKRMNLSKHTTFSSVFTSDQITKRPSLTIKFLTHESKYFNSSSYSIFFFLGITKSQINFD